ncbi:hypothetical protein DFJ58DRAFT_860870 [Suillus subalutaceus]|uniref:uncharacterized protein n=1 Tax=Suillus subalutaceus TaxID=48586 RepID=UPI001B88379D|nr:uncharacterized protein DFJ58DRAFT_860870 [Suillus subalutaceus]KAG1838625.1 hypothetical protein DFJ58DRAFT_860870 [Suillus subalutaceus]
MGEKLDVIHLDEEYEQLMKEPWVKYGTTLKLREFKELLDHLPCFSSCCFMSPRNLLQHIPKSTSLHWQNAAANRTSSLIRPHQ